MDWEIAEMLLCLAVASALPYALTAGADWFREDRRVHRTGADAPMR